jgi:restriction modification system DNA specificity domain protein
MRKDWQYEKLGDISSSLLIEKAKKRFNPNDVIRYIDISSIDNINQRLIGTTSFKMLDAPSRAQQKVEYGDILISTVRPNLRNIAIVNDDASNLVASSGFCVLRINDAALRRYIFYYVVSNKFTAYLGKLTNGANYPAVKETDVRKAFIPIPPKSTQLSIVSELDKLNELIRIKKEQLKDYDTLAQSIFYEMFGDPVEEGWDVKELGDICKTSSGGTPSKAHTEYYNGEIMWLRSGEVSQGDIYNTEQTITLLGLENSSAKIFPVNTVVIAMYGATVGQVGILRKEMSTNQAICGIFPNGDLTPEYLYYFLISKKAEFLKSAIGGAQANISQQIIRKTLIPLPPLSLQSSFTCKIRQIKLQKAAVQSTITDLETLLAARMQYWFD